ncbi:CDP-alcohol phosphatidyltransferase family protein [Roseomonas xinghualingensis]|uniref:CDP-alcohol phosphatidyltransferase family protein n=1 Tax=Roseomonas xinghualingensis TaxID=2986475 RepID=UPI0021F1D2B1|nr:CDP-alcohol phosphatidyltransferase family protein [Roseomonas sp. SXEYE001]MCV4208831.1 CDP-alcohol phosphatidyltransferase family protein [Roseomonas sp. SXEYE001]
MQEGHDPGLAPEASRGADRPNPVPPAQSVLFTLPNVITLARLCAVPAVVWLVIQHRLDIAFLLFVGAGISDAVDGWLARVRNARSFLGAILDPVADKALLVSVYVTLAYIGVLPDWLAILVVFRDLLIVGGLLVLALMGTAPAIRPLLVSKLNTLMQIAVAATALLLSGFDLDAGWLMPLLIGCVTLTTIASGAAYVRDAARSLPA